MPLVADLPGPATPPAPRPRRSRTIPPVVPLAILLVAIWALTGAGYFWPIWPIGALLIGAFKHSGHGCRPRVAVSGEADLGAPQRRPTAPACGPSSARTTAISSTGATQARRRSSARSGSSSSSPASATPPPTTTRSGHSRTTAPGQHAAHVPARALERRARDRIARPRRRGRFGHALAAGRGGDRLGARHPVQAAAVPASAQRAVRIDRRMPDLAGVAEPEVQPAADHHAAADAGPERDAHEVARTAAGAEAQLGQRERADVVDERDRHAERRADRAGDRPPAQSPSRFGSSEAVPVAASKWPGSASPAVAGSPNGAMVSRPSAATRSSTASSPSAASVGHEPVARTRGARRRPRRPPP